MGCAAGKIFSQWSWPCRLPTQARPASASAHHKTPALREKTSGFSCQPAHSSSGRTPRTAMDENCSRHTCCACQSVSHSSAPNHTDKSRQSSRGRMPVSERSPSSPSAGIRQAEIRPMPSAMGNPCSSNSRAGMALPEVMHCPSTAVRTLSGAAARNDPVCSIGSPPFLPDGKRMCGQGAVGPAGHTVRRKYGLRETHRCTIGHPQR